MRCMSSVSVSLTMHNVLAHWLIDLLSLFSPKEAHCKFTRRRFAGADYEQLHGGS